MKKRFVGLLVLQSMIWLIYRTVETLFWIYKQPEITGYIIRYKLVQFLFPGIITGIFIVIIYMILSRYANSIVVKISGLLFNTVVSIVFYFFIVSFHYKFIWVEHLHKFSFRHFIFASNAYWFLFFFLNLSCFLYDYWIKIRLQGSKIESLSNRINEHIKSSTDTEKQIYLPGKKNGNLIPVSKIKFIQADEYITKVITDNNKTYSVNQTLKKWEEKLPEKYFFRIHKSYIINLTCIERIIKKSNQTYEVYLKDFATCLPMSRRIGREFYMKYKS